MNNAELQVVSELAVELIGERKRREEATHNEVKQIEERLSFCTKANEDLKKRCADLMAERDDARRKLGALVLCVGFNASYDTKHPKRSILKLMAQTKKCIDDNHIVMTEGRMAK